MKSLLLLWSTLAHECASRCHTSATRDIETVASRVEHEGLSFLTITLPCFGKAFEKCLDQGWVDPALFAKPCSYEMDKHSGGHLPKFLGGFLDRVFDRNSGLLMSKPCIDSILSLRQLTLMYGKMLSPCSDARTRAAMHDFIHCEQEVENSYSSICSIDLEAFARISELLFHEVFQATDLTVMSMDGLMPKHGPGSTADKLLGNQKYLQREWTDRLEEIFPSGNFLLPNWSYSDQLSDVRFLEPGAERPVKVISVPKTHKTPRIIGIEPTCMQYMQQAVRPVIQDQIQRDDSLRKIIGFDDQGPNQALALEGSLSGELATLDLSEASDRVSYRLVQDMVAPYPFLSKGLDATRSRKADIPAIGRTISLSKYATMGSALCFPVEAMVFATVIFLGIERELSRPLTHADVNRLKRKVRVYGDDIIVPVDFVSSVVSTLETFGFRVNAAKSFWTGKFRESCGKEYYEGADVSIVRVRREFPKRRKDASEVISLVSLRNQLYKAGYWSTVKWLDKTIWKLLKHFPIVESTSSVQGRHSFLGYEAEYACENLQVPLVKGYVVKSLIPKNQIGDSAALLKCFLQQGDEPVVNEDHLERSGRPLVVDIKLRYATPY